MKKVNIVTIDLAPHVLEAVAKAEAEYPDAELQADVEMTEELKVVITVSVVDPGLQK